MSLDQFIGIRWEELGRSFSGCDCYGLVILYYKEELGIELPDYTPDKNKEWIMKKSENEFPSLGLFEEVKETRLIKNDIVWMKVRDLEVCGITNHLAVCVGNNDLLETTKGTGSVLVKASKRSKMIYKIFRNRELQWRK